MRISAREYAAREGLHEDTVSRWCREGRLVARKLGRWMIDVEKSDRALALTAGNAAERDLARRRKAD